MSSDDGRLVAIKQWDREFQRLTGREAFGHVSQPSPGSWRITFGDGAVCTSMKDAHQYMSNLLWLAQSDPERLPFPFDQELTREQDLRVINGWKCPVCGFDFGKSAGVHRRGRAGCNVTGPGVDDGRPRDKADVEAMREAVRRRRGVSGE